MIVRFLGTHNEESKDTRLASILIDGKLAIDAGSFVSELTFSEQEKIEAILLSHGHYDHIRSIPAFAFNNPSRTTPVFAMPQTLEILTSHLVDGLIYPDFTRKNDFLPRPVLKLCRLEAYRPRNIAGYTVTPLPVNHPLETVAFEIAAGDKRLLYLTDSGPGLHDLWERVSPQLLIIDSTYPDRLEKTAWDAGHLCPRLLAQELADFRQLRGYLPRVVSIHMGPHFEAEIRSEVESVAAALGISIELAAEGDRLTL
jgi:Cft2 family RNA processing exonuclease